MRLVPKFLLASCAALAFGAIATHASAEIYQTGSVNVPVDRFADVSWTKFEGPVNRLRFYADNDTINCEHITVTYQDGITREVFSGTIRWAALPPSPFRKATAGCAKWPLPARHHSRTARA